MGSARTPTRIAPMTRTERDRYKEWEAAEQERRPLNRGTPDNKVEAMRGKSLGWTALTALALKLAVVAVLAAGLVLKRVYYDGRRQ